MSRLIFIASLLIGVLVAGLPVRAQESGASGPQAAVEEIIVTARKREESLQDTPVAVSAFDAGALERAQVDTVVDLNLAVPGMLVTQTGGSGTATQIFIRGIGQDSLGFNSETPIGIYFDDVYMGRVQGTLMDLLDVERIEVLRGPQGTLYGRNSTTGAVKYVLRQPDLEEARYAADITVGNYDRRDVRASLSAPLVEGELALSLAASVRNQDGYVDGVDIDGVATGDDINGVDRDTGRIALLWQPRGDFSIQLAADATRDRSGVMLSTPLACEDGADSRCEPLFGDPFKAGINLSGQESDSSGVSARVEWSLGWADLLSITATRQLDFTDPIDLLAIPGVPLPINYTLDQSQFSQEFQLTSSADGPFTWVAGLFYFQEDAEQDSVFLGARRNVDDQSADSIAVYGEVGYDLTDTLSVNVGGRWTRDEKDIDRQIFSPVDAAVPSIEAAGSFEESVFTPRVSVEWAAAENALLYATYAEGYKPGGFAETWPATEFAATGQFGSEEVDSWELGAKTGWLDGRLTVNVAAYRINYDGLQQSLLTQDAFFVATSDVEIEGLEIEFNARPTANWLIYGNLGLLDDEIVRSDIPGDNLDRRLRYAPEETWKIGTELRLPLGGTMEAFGSVSVAHMGRTPMDQANTLSLFMPDYELIDARVGIVFGDGRWTVTAGGKNIGDEEYWRSGIPGLGRFYAPPATYALTVKASF